MSTTFYLESQKYDGRYMYVSCTQTPDILTNTSKIDWTFVSTGGNSSYYATGPTVVKINGQTVFSEVALGWTSRKFPTAKGSVSGSLTVPHNDDGSKSIEVYISTAIYYEATETHKDTWTLDTIHRFAKLESAPNFNDEANPKITYSNPAGNKITKLQACISLDGTNADIAYRDISKTGTSYTFNLTDSERDVLRSATTGSNSRTVLFYIRSYIGDLSEASILYKTFTIKNPNPLINPTIVDTNSKTIEVTGDSSKLVRYCSNAKITIGASAVKKATLIGTKVYNSGKTLVVDGTINGVTDNSFEFVATDNRGNTTNKIVTPSFVNYIKPTCVISKNVPDGNGNMTVAATGNYFNGSFGKTHNALNVYYRYKLASDSWSDEPWTLMTATLNGNTYSATAEVTGLDYQKAYTFQTYSRDVLNSSSVSQTSVTGTPVFDWGENDFNFNVPVKMKSAVSTDGITVEAQPSGGQGYYVTKTVDGKLEKMQMSITASGIPVVCFFEDGTLANRLILYRDSTVFSKPLTLASGGTGATTAAEARKNLGVGTNKVYNKLTDLGITEFPTTMSTVASSMPINSMMILDSRDVISGGTNEISDLGGAWHGIYIIIRGNSSARVTLLHIYGGTTATTGQLRYGCYASTNNAVVWDQVTNGVTMTKIWENSNPTSNFAGQTLSKSLSGYHSIYVECLRSTSAQKISGCALVEVGGKTAYIMGTTDQYAVTRRDVTATTTGITFSGFYSANTSDGSSNEIPYRIYGIKGVS